MNTSPARSQRVFHILIRSPDLSHVLYVTGILQLVVFGALPGWLTGDQQSVVLPAAMQFPVRFKKWVQGYLSCI